MSKEHLESELHQDTTIQSQDDELMLNMSAPAGVDSDWTVAGNLPEEHLQSELHHDTTTQQDELTLDKSIPCECPCCQDVGVPYHPVELSKSTITAWMVSYVSSDQCMHK